MKENQYYYISLKHTHKKDAFITLWGPNERGYQWYQPSVGLYDEVCIGDDFGSTKSINKEVVDELWMEVEFDGAPRKILPNVKKVREALGVKRKDFHRIGVSWCGKAKHFFQTVSK